MNPFHQALQNTWKTTLSIWTPPPNQTINEWAEQHYVLPQEHGGGNWRSIPFQVDMMNAMSDPEEERVTVMKSARVGYTKIVDLVIGYHIDADPCSMLVVQPTLDDAEGFSKDEIAPMLADVPALRQKVRSDSETILKKGYPGGVLTMVGANTPTGFRRLTKRIVIFDEVSAYPPTAGNEGDPVRLGEKRTTTAHNRKIISGSTPTIADACRIEKNFDRSDQRYYHVPCPNCGHFHLLEWSNLKWIKGKPETAHFICPECGDSIEEKHKGDMVDKGEWRSLKPFTCCDEEEQKPIVWDKKGRPVCRHCYKPKIISHAGFHIWAAYSPMPNATWPKLVEEWEEVEGNPEEEKTFINTVRGETYREDSIEVEWKSLYERREPYGAEYDGKVPERVRIILASVDTQGDRLEVQTVGFGEDEEAWLLNYFVIMGQPDQAETQAKLSKILSMQYTHACGFAMHITAAAVDVQGNYYDSMMQYCYYNSHICIPIRGGSDITSPAIKPPTRNNIHKMNLFTLGVNNIKNTLARRLTYKNAGRGFIHFPKNNEFETHYFQQLTAETAITERKNGIPYRVFKNFKNQRNEAWDLLVYVLALLWILNPDLSELPDYEIEEDDEDEFDDEEYTSDWMNN